MLTIDEYIARRKKEDKLDEFNPAERNENTKVCVNYIFEYFNNYLDVAALNEQKALEEEKIKKYLNQMKEYDSSIVEWLVRKIKQR